MKKLAKLTPKDKRYLLSILLLKICRQDYTVVCQKLQDIAEKINATAAATRDILYLHEQIIRNKNIINMLHKYQRGQKICKD